MFSPMSYNVLLKVYYQPKNYFVNKFKTHPTVVTRICRLMQQQLMQQMFRELPEAAICLLQ